jgi:hypothetical protein
MPTSNTLEPMPASKISLLRLPRFRRLATSALLNSVGMMGEVVVLGWLALELTDSPFLVGVAMGVRMLPLFFVGLPAGVVADRFPRHRVLMVTGVGQALTAAAIGGLILLGAVSLTPVLLLTLAAGAMRGLEHSARQSLAHDAVGAAALMSGLAVLGVAMRVGWLAGSLGAGAVIAHVGSGAAYFAVAASFAAGAVSLRGAAAMPPGGPPAGVGVWQSMVDFGAALRRDSALPALMVLTAGAEVLGFSHQALLPSLARDVLHVGPEGLGIMNAARSIGGILGLLAVAARGAAPGSGALFLVVLASFGASVVGLGLAPRLMGLAGIVVVLVLVNAVGAIADLLAQSLMQLSVPGHLRGRAGGAWVVAIGLAPLGQLQVGAVASLFGVSVALGASGLGLIALAAGTALVLPRMRRL